MNPILQQLQNEIASSLNGLDAAQTQLAPSTPPEKWNIQQILQHLCLTYAFTETAFNARLAKGTPTGVRPALQQHIAQYFVTTLGIFPGGREAPERVTPPRIASPVCGSDLAQYSAEHLVRIDKLFNEAEALFGRSRCSSHMILGPLSVHQWRRFHLVHGRHHIRQIRAIRADHHL
jgi:DinB superfamily